MADSLLVRSELTQGEAFYHSLNIFGEILFYGKAAGIHEPFVCMASIVLCNVQVFVRLPLFDRGI